MSYFLGEFWGHRWLSPVSLVSQLQGEWTSTVHVCSCLKRLMSVLAQIPVHTKYINYLPMYNNDFSFWKSLCALYRREKASSITCLTRLPSLLTNAWGTLQVISAPFLILTGFLGKWQATKSLRCLVTRTCTSSAYCLNAWHVFWCLPSVNYLLYCYSLHAFRILSWSLSSSWQEVGGRGGGEGEVAGKSHLIWNFRSRSFTG